MEASAEPCVAGESPWAASSAEQLLLPGAIQSPALCYHPPLPHRYPSSPLQAFCQARTGFPPSQRGLQWCSACANRAHTQCPPWAPTWGWWVGEIPGEIPKGAKQPGGVHSAGGGCEHGDSVPRAPHSFSGEPHPPCCSCSSSSIPLAAAPEPNQCSHLSGDPVKSMLPGLLLHQLLEQRLALNK